MPLAHGVLPNVGGSCGYLSKKILIFYPLMKSNGKPRLIINRKPQTINRKSQLFQCNTPIDGKNMIIELFNRHIKGHKPPVNVSAHDGAEGHWLEREMGLTH